MNLYKDSKFLKKRSKFMSMRAVWEGMVRHYSHVGYTSLKLFSLRPDRENGPNVRHLEVLGGDGCQPKLEDFLGGAAGCSSDTGATSDAADAQVDGGAQGVDRGIDHDPELKSLAAGFMGGGFPAEETQKLAAPAKKGSESVSHRTSIFRGVTKHRWTGRYEAHLWDNSCRREGQTRKGRQVYLGGYDKEEKAARAYDLAALKYWGPATATNFPVTDYERELEEMKHMSRQEYVAALRRRSSGFSRGASIYRGVTRHHQHGRWQARIGRVAGNKDLYLGTFSTQEEAAEAYDIAAIKFRGTSAVTNFDMSRYDVRSIASSNLPIGGASFDKPKASSQSVSNNTSFNGTHSSDDNNNLLDPSSATSSSLPSTLGFGMQLPSTLWAAPNYQNANGTIIQGTTPYSMELGLKPSIESENNTSPNEGFLNGCGHNYQDHGIGGTLSLSPEEGSTHDASVVGDGNENWAMKVVHPLQSTKPSLSAFRRPIFGIE